MAEPLSNSELILYQLKELKTGFDDIRSEIKDHYGTIDKRLEGQAVRIRVLEDEALRLKTTLLPFGMAVSAAIGVAVKFLIDSFGK